VGGGGKCTTQSQLNPLTCQSVTYSQAITNYTFRRPNGELQNLKRSQRRTPEGGKGEGTKFSSPGFGSSKKGNVKSKMKSRKGDKGGTEPKVSKRPEGSVDVAS